MNNKENELFRIVDNVVDCCSIEMDSRGTLSVTREMVLGKCRTENVVMTRCILVAQIISAGYSVSTIACLLHRTPHAIRHLLDLDRQYIKCSRAYRIASAEATIKCKEIGIA